MTQVEFLAELLEACKEEEISTALDTCGFAPAGDFEKVYDLVDLILYDLKFVDDVAHTRYTGVSNQGVLENLVRLAGKGRKVKVRIPMIPGITDTDDNIRAIVGFLGQVDSIDTVSLLPYNLFGVDKLRRYNLAGRLGHLQPQSEVEMSRLSEMFESSGYRVKVGG